MEKFEIGPTQGRDDSESAQYRRDEFVHDSLMFNGAVLQLKYAMAALESVRGSSKELEAEISLAYEQVNIDAEAVMHKPFRGIYDGTSTPYYVQRGSVLSERRVPRSFANVPTLGTLAGIQQRHFKDRRHRVALIAFDPLSLSKDMNLRAHYLREGAARQASLHPLGIKRYPEDLNKRVWLEVAHIQVLRADTGYLDEEHIDAVNLGRLMPLLIEKPEK